MHEEIHMILVPIVEKYNHLTSTEQKIADYILNNPEQALEKTASELAELSGTSPATVIRFSKKIGFIGLPDMKIGLAKYFHNNQFFEKDMIVKSNDSYQDCASKLLAQINEVCKTTAESIDYAKLEKVIHMIDSAKTIYLFGVGSSGTVALDLQQKLIRLNKKTFFIQDNQINLLSAITINSKDVVICFSFSGETKVILTSVKAAKEQGAYVVSILGTTKSSIGHISDISLLTPAVERKMRIGAVSSRYSQQYISDLIFLCLVSRHYTEAEELTLKANRLITSLNSSEGKI